MKLKVNILVCLLLFTFSNSYGQINEYNYKRELKGVADQWHKIILDDEIFGKVSQDFTDIRIFGIMANADTIEAPYLLRLTNEKINTKEVPFKLLNLSHKNLGYFFTFEIPTTESVNQIQLDFKQKNFDWKIKLEGSHDQNHWFTILENYRILSVKNELTDFQFTKLSFPDSKYPYFRLLINSIEKPELTIAKISQHEITKGNFRNYPVRVKDIKENKQSRQTEIDIELQMPVPLSFLKINVSDTYDYYRPVTIKYLTDSIRTDQGWKYNYNLLTSGTLNSIENKGLKFNSTIVKKLKIFIDNHDNQPLSIETIQAKGYIHELVVRFTEQGDYFLTYGNKNAIKPKYDINRFINKFPESLTALELGKEIAIEKPAIQITDPLFNNMKWLWVIMVAIILILGMFSIQMIRKK